METNKQEIDLSSYIPQNNDWIDETILIMGWPNFKKYAHNVYKLLSNMQPGKTFDIIINVQPKNRQLFIQFVCLFQLEKGNPFNDIYFNATTTILKRVPETNNLFNRKNKQFYEPNTPRN